MCLSIDDYKENEKKNKRVKVQTKKKHEKKL